MVEKVGVEPTRRLRHMLLSFVRTVLAGSHLYGIPVGDLGQVYRVVPSLFHTGCCQSCCQTLSARLNTASMASAIWPCVPGTVWAYTFIVVLTFACPNISLTSVHGTF